MREFNGDVSGNGGDVALMAMRADGCYLELRKAGNVNGEGKQLPDKKLTADIVSAVITVHSALGPGFLESIFLSS